MIIVAIIYIFIFMVDFFPLYKAKKKKELWIFILIFIPSLVLSSLIAMNIEVPSFDVVVWKFMEKIGIVYK